MTEEEYFKEMETLTSTYELDKEELNKKYAQENNPYKIGDIVRNKRGYFKIESMDPLIPYGKYVPEMEYYGISCTKEGIILGTSLFWREHEIQSRLIK